MRFTVTFNADQWELYKRMLGLAAQAWTDPEMYPDPDDARLRRDARRGMVRTVQIREMLACRICDCSPCECD